jgi:uncharacterized repeat protein (TIGR01451 family)
VLAVLTSASQLFGANISSFTPVAGIPGDFVTINGSGFYPGTLVVKFNGVVDPTAQATAADGTMIQATVPSGATTGPISVSVNGGAFASSSSNFTVGPFISDFSPASGGAGTHVSINGLKFVAANVTGAYFNGKAGVNFLVNSDTSISVDAPAGVTTGLISVRSASGNNTNANPFYVPPVITGFSPSSGRAGTNVTITGTNFLGATAVWFGSLSTSALTVLSNGAVRVAVPANAATGPIRVDAPAGSATTTSNFLVVPIIYGFTPGVGGVGTSVTVTGANFYGASSLSFNGTATSVSGVSYGQVSATVPAGATSGPLTLNTTNGSAVSSDIFYVPPSITSFTPNNSGPGTRITITGANFTNASAVSFNGTPAAAFTVTNNTTIGATVPSGFATGPLSVTTPGGTATSSGRFYAAPSITGFSPTHGLPGTNVTITGANLLDTSVVQFNGLAGTSLVVLSNGAVRATVPSGAQTGPITVVAPAGATLSAANFTLDYTADVGIHMFATPDPVLVTNTFVYTIQIANYGPFAATNVRFTNTLPASVSLQSSTITQGTINTSGNPITGNLGTLNPNGTAQITLTLLPSVAGPLTDSFTITADTADPVPGNNSTNLNSTVIPLPVLKILSVPPGRVRITWPVMLTNSVLEYTAGFGGTNTWTGDPSTVAISNTDRVVIESNNAAARFFRLRN